MKYSKYLNLFFVITIFGFFIFFCRYFLQKDENYIKNLFELNNSKKQLIQHVLFIPNFFHFLHRLFLINKDTAHISYIKKIFEFIDGCIKNNIKEISIDLINPQEMQSLDQETLNHFFQEAFWNTIYLYCINLNLHISIICNQDLLSRKQKKILETYKKKINHNAAKNPFKINFLINYDTITEIQDIFTSLVKQKEYIDLENVEEACHRTNINNIINTNFPTYDIVYTCSNTSITDSGLLHAFGAKIINLTYNLDELNSSLIDLIIKTTTHNNYEY